MFSVRYNTESFARHVCRLISIILFLCVHCVHHNGFFAMLEWRGGVRGGGVCGVFTERTHGADVGWTRWSRGLRKAAA